MATCPTLRAAVRGRVIRVHTGADRGARDDKGHRRHLFDITQGWGGTHPLGVPVVVVTHEPSVDWPHTDTFTFVDSVEEAVRPAKAVAGTRTSSSPARRSPSSA
ncbi:MAG TPA: hypothetical protein VH333_21815 [Pseudonocardiaceae bacterium]|nr:hypothetical protein [Pseudonocardiaceae bacterium]